MRYFSCLILIFGLLSLLLGCGEETDHDPELTPLEVVSVSPPPGGHYLGCEVTITFSNAMESVEIVVDPPLHHCVRTHTKFQGTTATWRAYWSLFLTNGIVVTLAVSGTDIYGQELEGFAPISFTFFYPDTALPEIVGEQCDPENGAVAVDPKKYSEKIIIAFSENMANVEVVSTHPEFPFTDELAGNILTISFLDGYTMPYNTRFTIKLFGQDLAGNPMAGGYDQENCEPLPSEYSFTTKAK